MKDCKTPVGGGLTRPDGFKVHEALYNKSYGRVGKDPVEDNSVMK